MAEKVRIMAMKEEGRPRTAIVGRLDCHCTSKNASSLRQGVFPITPSLEIKKKRSYHLPTIKRHDLKCLETICVKNI
jgi:hypothetical protein